VVDDGVLGAVREHADLAPLHVPPALALVEAARRTLPSVPHVLCPDTAFHTGMPRAAATYPLPGEWRRRYGLRRYGFHGLSYAWATRRAAELLGQPCEDTSMVLTHLGGGCSVCAVKNGRSVDTSMGFTPLEGVPMSTRSGSVDPGMLLWLLSDSRLTLNELRDGLVHRSGLLGLSEGLSGDTRDLVAAGLRSRLADLVLIAAGPEALVDHHRAGLDGGRRIRKYAHLHRGLLHQSAVPRQSRRSLPARRPRAGRVDAGGRR
jgi:acetate kinase